jgi:hypothetical protein
MSNINGELTNVYYVFGGNDTVKTELRTIDLIKLRVCIKKIQDSGIHINHVSNINNTLNIDSVECPPDGVDLELDVVCAIKSEIKELIKSN